MFRQKTTRTRKYTQALTHNTDAHTHAHRHKHAVKHLLFFAASFGYYSLFVKLLWLSLCVAYSLHTHKRFAKTCFNYRCRCFSYFSQFYLTAQRASIAIRLLTALLKQQIQIMALLVAFCYKQNSAMLTVTVCYRTFDLSKSTQNGTVNAHANCWVSVVTQLTC